MRAFILLTALQALTANAAPHRHRRRQVCTQSASSTTIIQTVAPEPVTITAASSQQAVTGALPTALSNSQQISTVVVQTSTVSGSITQATTTDIPLSPEVQPDGSVIEGTKYTSSTTTTISASGDTPASPEVESGGSVIEITETTLTGSSTYGTVPDFTFQTGTGIITTSAVSAEVSVTTTSLISSTVQILPSLTDSPNTSGTIISTGVATTASGPILSTSISTPSTSLVPSSAVISLGSSPAATMAVSSDIFAVPVAIDAPPSQISSRSDHPVPRLGIQAQNSPLDTNKFYANFFLGTQTAPSWTHPYSVAWAKGGGSSSSWGMSIAHIDANQRVYGPNSSTTGAASYFINPNGIQSIVLSAVGLGNTTTISTDSLTSFSANVNLLSGSTPVVTFPLVQGMAFVTAIYSGGTPLVQTGVFFRTVTKVASPKSGVTKYNILLEDGKTWLLYAYSTTGAALEFTVVNNSLMQATSNFIGFIQIAKNPGNAESLYDTACGVYPVSASLSGTASGSTGTYTLTFTKAGLSNQILTMFALPHHVQSFTSGTSSALTAVQLQTTTKGIATAVVADSWTLTESLPTTMDFAPWSPSLGSRTTLTSAAQAAISSVAASEVAQNMIEQSNLNSMYYSGKALAKFAGIVYTINDLLDDASLAAAGLTQLKAAFAIFANNTQDYPLVHETAWGGVVSSASYVTGDSGVDFGNTYYNDHHFHYGYFIYAAAVIGYLDPTWLTANKAWVNTLVRDVANPSSADNYFPIYRNFDWYHGHGWAHGLYESFDGKDEESSSEDSMHAYALKMWGRTIGDANLEARGNLQLAVTARSLQNYFLYTSDNAVEPAQFIGNKVSGILFENKIDHTTYFGANTEFIQGIHMIPLLPSSTLTRTQTFVTQEWNTYFSNGRVDSVVGGWKGLLYANLAIIDPVTSFNFFSNSSFDPSFLDGGASRTWYLAFAAGQSDQYSKRELIQGTMEARDHGNHGIPANVASNPAAPPINYASKPVAGRNPGIPAGIQTYPGQIYGIGSRDHGNHGIPAGTQGYAGAQSAGLTSIERKRDKIMRQLGEWIG